MTNQELNNLFDSAKQATADTSVEEITAWVGVAAAPAAAGIGIAGKLKLLIAKKAFIIMASTLGILGAVGITAALVGTAKVQGDVESQYKASLIEFQEKNDPSSEKVYIDESYKDSISQTEEPEENIILAPLEPVEIEKDGEFHIIPLSIRKLGENLMDSWSTSSSSTSSSKTIKGSGNILSNSRNVEEFSEIDIEGVFDVVLKQGTEYGVVVEADENLQDHIHVDVSGNVLTVSSDKVKIKKAKRAVVIITLVDVTDITLNGVGDLSSLNTLKLSELNLEVIGVGDAQLTLDCTNLELEYNGVGDVILEGQVTNADFEVNGVGDLLAYELEVENMELEQNGVGDSEINVSNELSIEFTGVGSVRYDGKPKITDIDKSGIGSVKSR